MPADLVVASNRGPISFKTIRGRSVATRGVGGLVTAVTSALRDEDAIWIAVALSDGDRDRVREGSPIRDEQVAVELEAIDDDLLAGYYRDASNRALWFAAHGAGALPVEPSAWDAYRLVNERIADRIAHAAAPDATVLVHDYHLCLVPRFLHERRPDLAISFFWHVPFPDVDTWRSLGGPVADELLAGIAAADVVGVHASRWARRMRACADAAGFELPVSILPLGIDAESLRRAGASQEVEDRLAALARFDDAWLIVRSDRIEPAKAIGDGLDAVASLLAARPELSQRVVHLVRLTSSRGDVPEYREERALIEARARSVNARFSRDGWRPIELVIEDDVAGSLAAFRRYDVLLITSRADGMNLVAREGPVLNERDGVLVLSTGAGAADTYADGGAILVEPGDVPAIAQALGDALDLEPAARRSMADDARARAPGMTPADWLDAQRRLAREARAQRLAAR
jgi:trehalose 6-phosphate synthase